MKNQYVVDVNDLRKGQVRDDHPIRKSRLLFKLFSSVLCHFILYYFFIIQYYIFSIWKLYVKSLVPADENKFLVFIHYSRFFKFVACLASLITFFIKIWIEAHWKKKCFHETKRIFKYIKRSLFLLFKGKLIVALSEMLEILFKVESSKLDQSVITIHETGNYL